MTTLGSLRADSPEGHVAGVFTGNGVSRNFPLVHGFNSLTPTVTVRDKASNRLVSSGLYFAATDANTVMAWFDTPPTGEFEWVAQAGPITTDPAPDSVPAVWDYLGQPFGATSLANLNIGDRFNTGTSWGWALRFTAKHTGDLAGVQPMLIARNTGDPDSYAKGDGGLLQIRIHPDDGTGRPDETTVLASAPDYSPALINDGFYWDTGGGGSSVDGHPKIFAEHVFTTPAPVTAGTTYYVVIRNIAADPVGNYISINHMQATRAGGPPEPRSAVAPQFGEWGTLMFGVPANPTTWEENSQREVFDTPPLTAAHTAIAALWYSDGRAFGNPYMEFSTPPSIVGVSRARERFTPTTAFAAGQLSLYAAPASPNAPGTIRAVLNRAAVQVWQADFEFAAAHDWTTMPCGVDLEASIEYTLELECTAGDIRPGLFRDGTRTLGMTWGGTDNGGQKVHSYDGPTQLGFGGGVYELSSDSGGSWSTVSSDILDLMAVFTR